MTQEERSDVPALSPVGGRQRAHLAIRFGHRRGLRASVEVTPAGLLAIGGLVSSILLSTAVLVRAAGSVRAEIEREH